MLIITTRPSFITFNICHQVASECGVTELRGYKDAASRFIVVFDPHLYYLLVYWDSQTSSWAHHSSQPGAPRVGENHEVIRLREAPLDYVQGPQGNADQQLMNSPYLGESI